MTGPHSKDDYLLCYSIALFTVQAVVFLRAVKLHKFGCFNS